MDRKRKSEKDVVDDSASADESVAEDDDEATRAGADDEAAGVAGDDEAEKEVPEVFDGSFYWEKEDPVVKLNRRTKRDKPAAENSIGVAKKESVVQCGYCQDYYYVGSIYGHWKERCVQYIECENSINASEAEKAVQKRRTDHRVSDNITCFSLGCDNITVWLLCFFVILSLILSIWLR
jgi:hypothetical protein